MAGEENLPPVGCMPKHLANHQRMQELAGAILRRLEWRVPEQVDINLMQDWNHELGNLLDSNLSLLIKRRGEP